MRRRILAFTLVLAMLLGLGPAYAAGAGAEEPAGEILSFTPLEQTEYTVPAGTPAEELGLPGTVAATVREMVLQPNYTEAEEADMPRPGAFDQPTPEVTYDARELETNLSVTWESQPAYDPDTAGVYTFTARAEGYALAEGAAWPAVTVTVEPAEEPAEEPVEEPAEEPVEEPTEEPVEEPVEEPAQADPNSALDGGVSLLADTGPLRYKDSDSDWTYTSDLHDIEKWLYGLPGFDKPTGPDIIIELVDDYLYADSVNIVSLAPPSGTLCIVRSAADGDEIYSIDNLLGLSISETAITLANIEVNAVLQVIGSVTHLTNGVTIRGNGIHQQAVSVQHDGTSPGELILSGTATIENGVYLSSKECKLSVEGPFNGTASVTEPDGSQAGGVIGTVTGTGFVDGQVVEGITCTTNETLQAVVDGGQLVWHDPTAAARYSDASGTGWTYTDSLSGAVTGVPDGGYVELLKDATLTEGLTVGDKSFTLRSYSGGEDTYTITRGESYTGSLLTVSGTGDVTLADIVLDGNQEAVTAAAPLLTIGGGTVTMAEGSTLRNNKAGPGAEAAGVYMTGGTFTLEVGAEISGNVLQVGGFQAGGIQVGGGTAYLRGRIIGNEGYDGGGVLVDGANANVTITGQVTNNRASAGGGVYVAEGSATLDGATVTGNAATRYNTGGAFLYNSRENASGSSLTLTGQVTITGNTYQEQPSNLQIYTSEDQPRTVTLSSGLSMDSDIGVRILTNTGLFATGEGVSFSDYVDVFTPDDGSYIVQAKEDGLYLIDPVARMSVDGGSSWTYYDSLDAAINAVNGGSAETNIVELLDNVTAGARVVQSKSLTLRSSTEEGAETYTITRAEEFWSTMFIAEADCTLIFEDIVVDGGDIDATSGTMIWANGGSVVLGEGAVVRNCVRSNNDSGAVEVNTTGTLTMRDGAAIENSRSDANGGAVKVAGTFNMEGGSITGSNASGSGGGVAVDSGGIFNMTGGSITGSSAGTSGGGVYVATGGAVSLSGAASISSNTAGSAASNLYLASGSTLTLTGPLTGAENSIGVTIDAAVTGGNEPGGTIGGASGIADSDDVTQIFSDVNSELVAVVESGALKWQEETTGVARYSADGESGWTYTETLSDAIANVPANGYVELLQDVTLTERITVSGKNFTLRSDSGGTETYTIIRGAKFDYDTNEPQTDTLFYVNSGGSMTLSNIILDGGAVWDGPVDSVLQRGTTNTSGVQGFYTIVITGESTVTLEDGAVIQNIQRRDESAGAASATGAALLIETDAEAIMKDGSLIQNVENEMSAVYIGQRANGTFTMEGGTIRGCQGNRGSAGREGASAVTVRSGTFTMGADATICNNKSIGTNTGTNIVGGTVLIVQATAQINGTIRDNSAAKMGGGVIALEANSVTIGGTITNNTAPQGGGVYVRSCTITLDGATITGNTATNAGGGVYLHNSATVQLTGETSVTDNQVGSADSNVCLAGSSAAITLTGNLTGGASVGVTQSGAAAGVSFGTASSADLQGADKFFCDSDPKLRGVLSGTNLIWGQYVAQLVGGTGDGSYYTTLAAAVAAYSGDTQYIAMVADSTGGTVTVNQNLYLDLAGHTVADSITVGDGFTLYGFDSTTNGYNSTGDYGMLTGLVSGTVANVTDTTADQTGDAMRYLKVTEDGGVSFHRFDMKPKSVVFRPSVAGIYFKGIFFGDEQVKNAILKDTSDLTFGLYFNLTGSTDVDADSASAHDPSTFATGSEGDTRQGAMVQNIVTEGDENNDANKDRIIYVSAYFNFADAGVTTRDSMNPITLTQVIRLAAEKYSTLDDTQKKAFDDFWVKFKDLYPDIQHTPETDDEETP